MTFLSKLEFSNNRPMMVGYYLSILITFVSCKTSHFYNKSDHVKMAQSDSIFQGEKQARILDYLEDFQKDDGDHKKL